MATTPSADKRAAIQSIADQMKAARAAAAQRSSESNIGELESLIESLKKQRTENTVNAKFMKNIEKKIDKATNINTYMRMAVPKFFKTFHENMDTYDKQREAMKKLEKAQAIQREKELKELKAGIDALVMGSKGLMEIKNRFGESAARHAALVEEEMKMFRQADEQYRKNMMGIEKRSGSLEGDAQKEWTKQRGIQLVKIVEDEPSKEELNDIKNQLAKQIELDAQQYETDKILAKKKATDERRNKEETLKTEKGMLGFLKNFKMPKAEAGNKGFLANLLEAWLVEGIVPMLLKGGLIAAAVTALYTGLKEYFTNSDFKAKVDGIVGDIKDKYIVPMWEDFKKGFSDFFEKTAWPWLKDMWEKHWDKILIGLAAAFPLTTLTLIGGALKGLLAALWWAGKAIYGAITRPGTPLPDVDTPDKKPSGGGSDKSSNKPKPKRTPQPRDSKGRFMKRLPGVMDRLKSSGGRIADLAKKGGSAIAAGGRAGGGLLGKLLTIGGGSLALGLGLFLQSGNAGPENEAMQVLAEYGDDLPWDLTDEEIEDAILAIDQGGVSGIMEWKAKHMEENGLMLNPNAPYRRDQKSDVPRIITKDQAASLGVNSPRIKPPVQPTQPLLPLTGNLGIPGQGAGGSPLVLAPSTTNNSASMVIPWRTAKDTEAANSQFARELR